jgi:hypothetical protein
MVLVSLQSRGFGGPRLCFFVGGEMREKRSSSWHKDPVKAVEELLVKAEKKLGSDEKFTVGDYIRLLQLREELGDEAPTKVEVLWVEPTEPSALK